MNNSVIEGKNRITVFPCQIHFLTHSVQKIDLHFFAFNVESRFKLVTLGRFTKSQTTNLQNWTKLEPEIICRGHSRQEIADPNLDETEDCSLRQDERFHLTA